MHQPSEGRNGFVADYEIVRPLAAGNHGQFFLARPPRRLGLDVEHVAVKVYDGECSEDVFRRCVRELRAFASAASPYIAKVYDAILDRSFLYCMEYFPRGSLEQHAGPLSREHAYRATEQVSLAAHALHEAGIAHRDIKPGNVLLTEDGARLADLGLSQLLAPDVSVSAMGPAQGAEFLDPALLYGHPASRATDIWSLGALLHRALSGKGLYGDLSSYDPLRAVRTVLGTPPQVDGSLSPGERALVHSCIGPDETRPRTALEVADRLAALRDSLTSHVS